MAGRYKGNREVPKAPFPVRAGRWLARRGYDLANMLVPGTLFDYRERQTINPVTAWNDSTVREIARWARGRPEGMSDAEWERIRREGKEGVFDSAWDLLPIPKIPYVTRQAGLAVRRGLLGPPPKNNSGRRDYVTVVPTVTGQGVTTTEKPVTIAKPADATNKPRNGRSSFIPNSNSLSGSGNGGTIGSGVGVSDDPTSLLDMLDLSGGFGGVGYRGVAGGIDPYTGLRLEQQDLYNTVTGAQVLPSFNNGAYDAEHRATSSNRARF